MCVQPLRSIDSIIKFKIDYTYCRVMLLLKKINLKRRIVYIKCLRSTRNLSKLKHNIGKISIEDYSNPYVFYLNILKWNISYLKHQ